MIIIIVLRVREVTVAATATTSSNNLAANRHSVKSTKCLLFLPSCTLREIYMSVKKRIMKCLNNYISNYFVNSFTKPFLSSSQVENMVFGKYFKRLYQMVL